MLKFLIFSIVVLSPLSLCKTDEDFIEITENDIEPQQIAISNTSAPYFLAQIVHGTSTSSSATCSAIIFNSTDAITYGNCLQYFTDPCIRYVNIISPTYRNSTTSCTYPFVLHPKIGNPDSESTNFGIAKINPSGILRNDYEPRALSGLSSSPHYCILNYFTGPNVPVLNRRLVEVLPPSQCGSDDEYVHCTYVQTLNDPICEAQAGSGLDCSSTTVGGLTIRNTCEEVFVEFEDGSGRTIRMKRYISLAAAHEWVNSSSSLSVSLVLLSILAIASKLF